MIPGYSYYKQAFEACDNFNRALHNRCWPHKRDGRNLPGNIWNHHDFIQAAMLENTISSWFYANGPESLSNTFEEELVTMIV